MTSENNLSDDRFLTTQELMKFLGLSRSKIWTLIRTEGLPAFKIGGDYRYRSSEIITWMENFRIKNEFLDNSEENI
ncbi:MAG: helix-turn-helix domain-containing protein [Planctomycetaceae bacterium]|nr:helix-turn-helix domain-containing protein [Planctomycetaceae bacterium]MBQ2822847.1 helix-turn-helix domain-containing protein [Thermoguttaceae bacterium]